MVQVSEVADSVFVLLSLSPTSARELKSCIQMALRSLKCFTSKAVAQDVASGACKAVLWVPLGFYTAFYTYSLHCSSFFG